MTTSKIHLAPSTYVLVVEWRLPSDAGSTAFATPASGPDCGESTP